MPPPPEAQIVLRLPRALKGLFVAAARASGLTLFAWILATLTRQARADLPPGHPALPPDP